MLSYNHRRFSLTAMQPVYRLTRSGLATYGLGDLDVYLLGATLYQLCTQLLPKLAGLRPIHEVNPSSEASEDFSRLLCSALEPEVSHRLPSARS
ncbi:hypothetical protein OV203_11010 [Nannocystis sp. ILAH1]|uniref:hypothetical protein n=1 Tax=unclassified Nannocystis TaxID=2627009 RepID=UPI002270E23B|nr:MULTISPECIES: hypothetical protein [unclassified Nannocystis]MCY0987656.1 hypothetical protein [Nannocystis sp. ILAH1]MCY1070544.1 hypothetical protein [Nannocystis sp. RBIL2]